MCVIWPQKHENLFFTKVCSQRTHFFVYRRPQGIYADLTSESQREQTTGAPPFCVHSVTTENPRVRKSGVMDGGVRSPVLGGELW